MADCQFYLFRDPDTKDGVAIIEVPKINRAFHDSPVELDELIDINLSSGYSYASWNGWANQEHSQVLELKFEWHSECVEQISSDAFRYFIGSRPESKLMLECMGEAEAKTALVIGQLDHFQTKGARSKNATAREVTILDVVYVGKVDPAED